MEDLWEWEHEIWALVAAGVGAKSAFHLPVVADRAGEARIVTLRGCEASARSLWFHTDARTEKVRRWIDHPQLSWVFYDPASGLQVRMRSRATVHHGDEVAKAGWKRTRPLARRCYLSSLASGSPLLEFGPGFPPDLCDREPSELESAGGFAHFCVVRAIVHEVEALGTRFRGHRRARWQYAPRSATWLVP